MLDSGKSGVYYFLSLNNLKPNGDRVMGTPRFNTNHTDVQDLSGPGEPSIDTLMKLNGLFNLLGPSPKENIDLIVDKASELLKGCCSFYDRFDEQRNCMRPRVGFNLPPGFRQQTESARKTIGIGSDHGKLL